MKYTDTLFSFPVKIYDGFSVRKNIKREELIMDDLDAPLPDDWVEGVAEVPLKEIQGYVDHYSAGRKVEEVAKEGFDSLRVMTFTMGDFVCTLTRKQFKERLNSFAEKYEKLIEELADEIIEKANTTPLIIKKKTPWWKRIFS